MKKFIRQHQYYIFAFIIFIIVAVVSGTNVFRLQTSDSRLQSKRINLNNEQQVVRDEERGTDNIATNEPTSKIYSDGIRDTRHVTTPTPPVSPPPGGSTTATATTTTSLVTNYQLPVTTTSTVYDLMKAEQTKGNFNFKTKTFPGMGEFVEEINGLNNDNRAGKYWIYYINGESAKMGISLQIVKPNDVITWKYETTNL